MSGVPFQRRKIATHWITLALGAMLALASSTALADLVARLSAPQIDETQTLELTIRTDSRDVQGMPDLKPVSNDFEILTQRTNSQYRVMNGNVQAWTDWIIALRPLRTGLLKIPPLSYRGEQTEPLELRVVPLDPALKKQMGDRVFFETSTEPEQPFVQAQVIFIRRLLYADGTQIYGEMPDTPVVADAVVIPLGNATSSTVTRNDKRYGMIEQRYALFPERSGELTIPGAVVSGSVRMNVNGRLRRNGVRVVAEPMTLSVRPIPPDYPKDTPWLPATRVDIVEAWDQSPPQFQLGQPLTQTLIVRSDAATGSIIPPLNYDIPDSHFRTYPEQPDIADNQRSSGIIGTRSQTWSLIPTRIGEVVLPMIELTWFDTKREEVRVSRLARRTLTVAGSTDAPDTPPPIAEAETDANNTAQPPDSVDVADRRVFSSLGASLLAVLIGILAWRFWPRGIKTPSPPRFDALTPTPIKRRQRRSALYAAVQTGDESDIREALEAAVAQYRTTNVALPAEGVSAIQRTLSSSLYAPQPMPLDRTRLTTLVDDLFTPTKKSDRKASQRKASLPALYRS